MPPTIAPPASTDNATVILWVVGVLVLALGIAVIQLWRVMTANAEACRDESKAAQARIDDLHDKIDELHKESRSGDARRETTLLEVVAANTQAMRELTNEIGSGAHRAIANTDRTRG